MESREDLSNLDARSDAEIVALVQAGRVAMHSLEDRLTDLDRAVALRRRLVLGASIPRIPPPELIGR